MRRRNGDVHHDIVANVLELEREERTALALASRQIAGSDLDVAGETRSNRVGWGRSDRRTAVNKSSNSATLSGRSAVGSVHASGAQSSRIAIVRR